VEDADIRERIFAMIEEEWHLTQKMLQELRGGEMGSRRPRFAKTLDLRADALRVLHGQQVHLLRRWRALGQSGDQAAADAMLPQLLLSINAIASGLRTTG
jgi:phosphoenolpyruvate carboxylase